MIVEVPPRSPPSNKKQLIVEVPPRSPPSNKKQLMLLSEEIVSPAFKKSPPPTVAGENRGNKVGEMIGGAAADCAAVCCCCPCAVLDLLLLTFYKVPKAVCKKVWRRRKQLRIMKKKKRQGLLTGGEKESPKEEKVVTGDLTAEMEMYKKGGETETVDFEKEMWDRFYGTGFWRSPSQRDT